MGSCHYCINCGRCRGEKPKGFTFPICMACGFENEEGVTVCSACGASLVLQSGTTNTAGKPLAGTALPRLSDSTKGAHHG